MKRTFIFLLLLHFFQFFYAQKELNYPTVKFGPASINANWVSHPAIEGGENRVILFRNTFKIENPSEDFIINISADNHYYLYLNGEFITHGPQLSDIRHWKYETLNLKGRLQKGENTMAVKVVNFGKRRFLGLQSLYTCLMVNSITENATRLNTKGIDDYWKCTLDDSYNAIEVNWRGDGPKSIVGGFYANNPTDFVDMNLHPMGWEHNNFDDSEWQNTEFFEGSSSMGGSIAYLLEPRNLPLLTWEEERLGKIVRSSSSIVTDFPAVEKMNIPPHSTITFLIDQKYVTSGFPELIFGKGKDASIKIKYAENLFDNENAKGDRNDIKDKRLLGYYDIIISNGSSEQKFVPNWMRTFRFIEFEIATEAQELELYTFFNNKSRTTIPSTASFNSDNDMYNSIFDLCKRTVDICVQDYFLSDAYYETMQYVGDTKIHALIWQSLSGNLVHTKNAIAQFHHSLDSEGNVLGAYPLRSTFIYPTYSLIWIDMIFDYVELTGDTDFLNNYKDGIVLTLAGFEKNMNALNLVNETPYRYFVDWYAGPNDGRGTATNNGGKNSAVVSLHYVHSLMNASKLLNAVDDKINGEKYERRAIEIRKSVYEQCYDPERNLFAERPDKSIFDQHTNIMAVLTDAIPENEQKDLLRRILEDNSLLQATYYYRFYLFQAIKKVNVPELFALAQKPWEQMVEDNMTTTLERFESNKKPTRSEVHPWSASPAYFYFDYLAGIQSVKNNFEEVRIAPSFGELKHIEGVLPTVRGTILFDLKKSDSGLLAEIDLPEEMYGNLFWEGNTIPLVKGNHTYTLKKGRQ